MRSSFLVSVPKALYNSHIDVVYRIQGSEFEWDSDKAQSNLVKHGVTFEEAVEAFFDPFYQTGDASVDEVKMIIPIDTMQTLAKVASNRDMSVQALLKLYIGQGLRQDAAQLYADRVLEMTAEVLARHVASPDEVAAILHEIRSKAA